MILITIVSFVMRNLKDDMFVRERSHNYITYHLAEEDVEVNMELAHIS